MQSRSGELAVRALPAVLLDLHEDLATGKLLLQRGRMSKSVDLVNGNPVSTASSLRDETLGHFLVGNGTITEEQHSKAIARAAAEGGKLGEALVALRMLTVEGLFEQLGRQARYKLVQALRWPQGAWRFDDGTEAAEGMQLRMLDIVFGGLRETGAQDLARLSRLDGLSFDLTDRGKRLRHELKKLLGERAFAVLSAGAPIGDIERAHGERADARNVIDSLILCDAIAVKGAPRAQSISGGVPVPISAEDSGLYSLLFDDTAHATPGTTGAVPLALMDIDDSGVVSLDEILQVSAQREHARAAQRAILAEHARIQGADHYAVLLVDRDAAADDIIAAHQIKRTLFERSAAGSPEPRATEVLAAYDAAAAVLRDREQRAAYDRVLAGAVEQVPPSIDMELEFRTAEEAMATGEWDRALELLEGVVARAPDQADYHAALAWAAWRGSGDADAARAHLDRALSIDPDHAAAHDFKGRIEAALGEDETAALFHLERALDLAPARADAVAAVEALLVSRGELRRLERVLKRLLFRLHGKGGAPEADAWVRLAWLYLDHLDDADAAAWAVANARRLAPDDPRVHTLVQRTEQQAGTGELSREGWYDAVYDAEPGSALVTRTAEAGHPDAAFLVGATMVALGTADGATAALYEAHRATEIALPQGPIDEWALVRHDDDTAEIGALLELLSPAVHVLAPMSLADAELDAAHRIPDDDLPYVFASLRAQLSQLLEVPLTPVYSRVELGGQIHVMACEPPVLVVGEDALGLPDGPELVFRLARALTFLWPGRAVGASRPGRVLRAVVLAIVREGARTDVGHDDPLAAKADAAIAMLPPAVRDQAKAVAARLLALSGGGLNLSAWAKSLTRSADRAGLLLCADIPAAFAGAREAGELDRDLVEFAYGAAHVTLRAKLGIHSS